MPRRPSPSLAFCLVLFAASCQTLNKKNGTDSGISSFTLGNYVPQAGAPAWASVNLDMESTSASGQAVKASFQVSSFKTGSGVLPQVVVRYGTYTIDLVYKDASGNVLYQECAAAKPPFTYNINQPQFTATIPVCSAATQQPSGQPVQISPTANVTLNPTLANGGGTSANGGGTSANGAGTTSNGGGTTTNGGGVANFGYTPPFPQYSDPSLSASCLNMNTYGLPTGPIPGGTVTSYPAAGSLSELQNATPQLTSSSPSSDVKAFVAGVYAMYPVFAQIFQSQLGLTQTQALAFFYGDMTRESASNASNGAVQWNISLVTANPGNPAYAFGPFQAAITNYSGGFNNNADGSVAPPPENFTGLPLPPASDFNDPVTSTYTGMKRLAEGVLNAFSTYGPGKPAAAYLIGALDDHNNGSNSLTSITQTWSNTYPGEVFRFMQAYQVGSNMTNNTVFYYNEPGPSVCASN